MIRLFKHHFSYPAIFLAIIDCCPPVAAADWADNPQGAHRRAAADLERAEGSFVGPHPDRSEFVVHLERLISYYAERHMVKPGIIGWAQINYAHGASNVDLRHKLECDLDYAKNHTPFLDLVILLQTLRVALWPEGVR